MYDAEIKLGNLNERNSRQSIDYDHLEKMIGGPMLIGHEAGENDDGTNDNRGLVEYVIHDEDAQHRLATKFQLQDIRIISCNIPLEWYKEFVHVFLISAEKYDVYRKPHVVLMKAIAHGIYQQPHMVKKNNQDHHLRYRQAEYGVTVLCYRN
ncbi:hypothetical protein JTB14_032467 [Gonioctena quinquepunctata]|nr:hypothetical protein JTB14_032467 [Gonioctena quinquepunctata]